MKRSIEETRWDWRGGLSYDQHETVSHRVALVVYLCTVRSWLACVPRVPQAARLTKQITVLLPYTAYASRHIDSHTKRRATRWTRATTAFVSGARPSFKILRHTVKNLIRRKKRNC